MERICVVVKWKTGNRLLINKTKSFAPLLSMQWTIWFHLVCWIGMWMVDSHNSSRMYKQPDVIEAEKYFFYHKVDSVSTNVMDMPY